MTKNRRWLKSAIAAAKGADVVLPWVALRAKAARANLPRNTNKVPATAPSGIAAR